MYPAATPGGGITQRWHPRSRGQSDKEASHSSGSRNSTPSREDQRGAVAGCLQACAMQPDLARCDATGPFSQWDQRGVMHLEHCADIATGCRAPGHRSGLSAAERGACSVGVRNGGDLDAVSGASWYCPWRGLKAFPWEMSCALFPSPADAVLPSLADRGVEALRRIRNCWATLGDCTGALHKVPYRSAARRAPSRALSHVSAAR